MGVLCPNGNLIQISGGSVMMTLKTPLDNFPVVRTQSPDEVKRSLAKIYAEPQLEFLPSTRKLYVHINNCHLQNISLAYGAYSSAMRVELPGVDRYMQLMPIRGEGEIACGQSSAAVKAGDTIVISPNVGYKARYSADREQLALTINMRALISKLTALIGVSVTDPPCMELQADPTSPVVQALRDYIVLIVKTLDAADAPPPNWWLSQAEQLVITMFLFGHRHNYSHYLERNPVDAAAWQVRRAEEYVEENCAEPVTLEALAAESGVSAFDLWNTFRRMRGYSPVEFASWVRAKRNRRH